LRIVAAFEIKYRRKIVEPDSGRSFEPVIKEVRLRPVPKLQLIRQPVGGANPIGILVVAFCLIGAAAAAPHDPSLQALAGYNVILEKNPDDLLTLRARGSTFRALELYDDALVDFERAEKISPDHYETVGEIGICRYMLGDIDEAREILQRAEKLFVARDPSGDDDSETAAVVEMELRETLMALYRESGEYEEALAQWDLMEKFLGGKLAAKCDRADILLDLGRVDEAMELYQDAVEWNGVFERFCVGAANCLILKGYTQKAIEIFERWSVEDPDLALPHMHRGIVLRDHMSDEAGARIALDEALSLAGASVDTDDLPDFGNIIIKARVQQAAGAHAAAAETIEKILDYSRGHHLVVHLLSVSYRALGRVDEALSLEKEARLYKRLNPRDWLQAYDIFPPVKETARNTAHGGDTPPEPSESPETEEVAENVNSYLLVGCAIVIPGAIFLWLLLRRKRIE